MKIYPNKANLRVSSVLDTTNVNSLKLKAENLPVSFNKWMDENKLVLPKDQGDCGSCWAVSSTTVLSDRFMIAKNIKNLDLNSLFTVSCSKNENFGCDGGQPLQAGKFFEEVGATISGDNCISWETHCSNKGCTLDSNGKQVCSSCTQPPDCKGMDLAKCSVTYKALKNSTKSTLITESNGVINNELTILNMKNEIMKNGSIVACFFVSWDIYCSKSEKGWKTTNNIFINGCYNDDTDTRNKLLKSSDPIPKNGLLSDLIYFDNNPNNLSGHAIAIVGWGEKYVEKYKTNIPYWICRNSWGQNWGENGFFNFAMTNKNLNINIKLGLDVGIVAPDGSIFGGGTTFLPDLTSGDSDGTVYEKPIPSPSTITTNSENKVLIFIKDKKKYFIIGGVVISVIIILYLLKDKFVMKNKRPPDVFTGDINIFKN